MRTLFVGGGTLGSVTPLLAVAEELRMSTDYRLPTTDYYFWGTRFGPERQIVEAAGIPFRTIPAGKLRRYFDVRNITDLFVMEWAFWVSLVRLMRDRPSVVVGAGSFVQVPVMWAAWFLRIPVVIHQLDARPGLANRLCAPIARAITVTFPESAASFVSRACRQSAVTKMDDRPKLCIRREQEKEGDTILDGRPKLCHFDTERVRMIGAPVRRAVLSARDRDQREAKRTFGFSGDRPLLLILGGGTGAQALNDLVAGALAQLTAVADVIHATGHEKARNPKHEIRNNQSKSTKHEIRISDFEIVSDFDIRASNFRAAYCSFPLLTDLLPDALAAADLVVSRAGMGTIAELGALGKPTVLVPMPNTHQEENAAALEKLGAVEVWHQRDLTPQVFAERVQTRLVDGDRCTALGATFTRVFPANAAQKLAEVIRAT